MTLLTGRDASSSLAMMALCCWGQVLGATHFKLRPASSSAWFALGRFLSGGPVPEASNTVRIEVESLITGALTDVLDDHISNDCAKSISVDLLAFRWLPPRHMVSKRSSAHPLLPMIL
jgi:hypothetical protein